MSSRTGRWWNEKKYLILEIILMNQKEFNILIITYVILRQEEFK